MCLECLGNVSVHHLGLSWAWAKNALGMRLADVDIIFNMAMYNWPGATTCCDMCQKCDVFTNMDK